MVRLSNKYHRENELIYLNQKRLYFTAYNINKGYQTPVV
jgi:hypothetical protein